MKKATISDILSTAIVCYLFWLVITGQMVSLVKGEPAPQVLILGAIGLANMWLAVFADVGVMILAVLNAIRALFTRRL